MLSPLMLRTDIRKTNTGKHGGHRSSRVSDLCHLFTREQIDFPMPELGCPAYASITHPQWPCGKQAVAGSNCTQLLARTYANGAGRVSDPAAHASGLLSTRALRANGTG